MKQYQKIALVAFIGIIAFGLLFTIISQNSAPKTAIIKTKAVTNDMQIAQITTKVLYTYEGQVWGHKDVRDTHILPMTQAGVKMHLAKLTAEQLIFDLSDEPTINEELKYDIGRKIYYPINIIDVNVIDVTFCELEDCAYLVD